MKKSAIAIVVAIILVVAMIAGCAQTNAPASPAATSTPAQTSTPAAPAKIALRTVGFFGGADPSAPYYTQLIQSFMDANKNVTVTDESATSDEVWKAKVMTDFSAGNEPDVLLFFTGADAKKLIEGNKVVSIEDIQKDYPDYAKSITPSAMNFMTEFDGKHYAVPVRGFFEGLFCNKDLFDANGIALPTDWDKFMAAVDAFKAKGIVPIAASFSDVPHYWIEHTVLAAGGVADHKVNPKDSYPASWVSGLDQITALKKAGAFNKDLNSTKNDLVGNLFVTKKAAMYMDGSWFMGTVTDKANTVLLPFPAMTGSPKDPSDIIAGFSGGFYISKKAYDDPAKREACVKFVESMTTPEAIALLCKDAGSPAAQVPASDSMTALQKSGFDMAGAAKQADMPIDSRMNKEAWTYLVSQIPALADGKTTAQKLLDEVLKKNK